MPAILPTIPRASGLASPPARAVVYWYLLSFSQLARVGKRPSGLFEPQPAERKNLLGRSESNVFVDLGCPTINLMQRKMFWIIFTLLGLLADFTLPFWWACAATIPIVVASWWIAYRSDWF